LERLRLRRGVRQRTLGINPELTRAATRALVPDARCTAMAVVRRPCGAQHARLQQRSSRLGPGAVPAARPAQPIPTEPSAAPRGTAIVRRALWVGLRVLLDAAGRRGRRAGSSAGAGAPNTHGKRELVPSGAPSHQSLLEGSAASGDGGGPALVSAARSPIAGGAFGTRTACRTTRGHVPPRFERRTPAVGAIAVAARVCRRRAVWDRHSRP